MKALRYILTAVMFVAVVAVPACAHKETRKVKVETNKHEIKVESTKKD